MLHFKLKGKENVPSANLMTLNLFSILSCKNLVIVAKATTKLFERIRISKLMTSNLGMYQLYTETQKILLTSGQSTKTFNSTSKHMFP